MQKIILLYNDKDSATVRDIRVELMKRHPRVFFWMANEDLTAFGDIFDQIESEIQRALGVVIFLDATASVAFKNTSNWLQSLLSVGRKEHTTDACWSI